MRPRKTRAAHHRRSRKHYAVAVSRDVHRMLHVTARLLGVTPGAVIDRLLDGGKGDTLGA